MSDNDEEVYHMEFDDELLNPRKRRKVSVSCRYLCDSIVALHSKFIAENPENKMSLTTFWKNIPKYYVIDGQKRTDLCHLCELGKKAEAYQKTCEDPEILKEVKV